MRRLRKGASQVTCQKKKKKGKIKQNNVDFKTTDVKKMCQKEENRKKIELTN